MPNLIDQMNILKNLPDQSLAGELAKPTGAVPGYLVLSEVNRRKDMRQRYAGQMAQKRPTTVVEDELSALAPPPGAAAGPGAPMLAPGGVGSPPGMPAGAPMPTGIAAAPPDGAPQGYARSGIVGGTDHYAYGGYVTPAPAYGIDTNPYGALQQRYTDAMTADDSARAQAPWLALMQAGLSIAGGTSPNALTNIGAGGAAGLSTYADLMKQANSSTANDLQGLTEIQRAQQAQAESERNFKLDQEKFAASQDPNNPVLAPTSIQEARAINAMPDGPEKTLATTLAEPYAAQTAQVKQEQVVQIGDAIIAGDAPPDMSKMYGMAGPLRAYLAGKGYNLTDATYKYTADLANLKNLNGPGQLRLRQGISQLEPTLESAKALADEWNGSGFPPFNKAMLLAAANDPADPKKAALANNLLAQVDHVTAELGQVYMGGNSPTDAAFKLSASQLNGDWSAPVFDAAIKQIMENLSYRKSSLNQAANYGGLVPQGTPSSVSPAGSVPSSVANPDGTLDLGGGVTLRQVGQ